VPDDSDQPSRSATDESVGTVLIAGAANLAIAVAKLVGGLISGSSAMLAEAAHSFADTLNQVFLMAALKRSQKPADAQHPFGYGMERYFWSLLAAVGIFVLGAGYSIVEGLKAVLHAEPLGSLTVSYIVLGLGVVFEGTSWWRAVKQLSGEAEEHDRGFFEHLRITSDPTAKTVAFEDTAALVGLVLAAVGITLHHLTGQGFWDGTASILIGLLLVGVAFALGQQNKRALIGEALTPAVQDEIREIIRDSPGIDSVVELLTMRMSPEEVLVAARVDLDDDASVDELEQAADEVERRLRDAHPEVRHVFLDPTDEPSVDPTDEPSEGRR
jgi:cation diffusion facilitator family transporter